MQVGESVDDAFTICYSRKSIVTVDYLSYREKGFTLLLIGLNVTMSVLNTIMSVTCFIKY